MKRLLLLVASAWWLACSPPVSPPPAPPACDTTEEGCPCLEDADCGPLGYCSARTERCVAKCASDSECNSREVPLARCAAMGCWCEFGDCVPRQCSADADCPGQVCRNATCVAAPSDTEITRCEVQPDFVVLQPGDRVQLEVLAWNASGEAVVSAQGPNWSAPAPFEAVEPLGNTLSVTVGTTTGATPPVTARWGSTECSAQTLVLPSPTATEVIVSVVDETSGRPVPGARVLVSDDAGAVVPQNGADFTRTDANGVVVLDGAAVKRTVSVFHEAFAYQTLVATSARTLRFFVRRNPLDTLGGVVTTVKDGMDSNLRLGRTGLSGLGDPSAFELTDEAEPVVATNVIIGSAVNLRNSPMPVGTFMAFGDQRLKPTTTAFGVPSACDGVADGTCGTQAAWGLFGSVPLGDIPAFEFLETGRLEFMPLMLRLPPAYRNFRSSVVRDARFTFAPTPGVSTGQPDFSATSHFTRLTQGFDGVPMGFLFGVRPPTLPQGAMGFPDQLLGAGVVRVAGRGAIPLGFGARPNVAPADARADPIDERLGMSVRMAPAHHGLEGHPYELMTVARWTQYRQTAWLGRASSTLRTPLGSRLRHAAGVDLFDLRDETLLPPPTGRFDFAARRFSGQRGAVASVLRVTFVSRTGAKWDVLVDPGAPAFTLPLPPDSLLDRVFADGGLRSLERSKVVLLNARHGQATFDELAALGATERLPSAWAEHALRPLSVVLRVAAGATVARGAQLEAVVEGFQPGVDGALRISFPGSTCPASTLAPRPDPSGLVAFVVPQTCSGALTLRAELVDPANVALVPAVASEVAIQVP